MQAPSLLAGSFQERSLDWRLERWGTGWRENQRCCGTAAGRAPVGTHAQDCLRETSPKDEFGLSGAGEGGTKGPARPRRPQGASRREAPMAGTGLQAPMLPDRRTQTHRQAAHPGKGLIECSLGVCRTLHLGGPLEGSPSPSPRDEYLGGPRVWCPAPGLMAPAVPQGCTPKPPTTHLALPGPYRCEVDAQRCLARVLWGRLRERGWGCDHKRGQRRTPSQAGAGQQGAAGGVCSRNLRGRWGRLGGGWWRRGRRGRRLRRRRRAGLGEEGEGETLVQAQRIPSRGLLGTGMDTAVLGGPPQQLQALDTHPHKPPQQLRGLESPFG